MSRILIAGMGSVLHKDDGFGVEVAKRLMVQNVLRARAKVIEVGTGGIHLVQELMAGYDALIVVDTIAKGSAPGTVHVLQTEVPDLSTWAEARRREFLADMHYATPTKAMVMAKAVGALPPQVYLVGCQPLDVDEMAIGLSEPVARAVDQAIREIVSLVQNLSMRV